MVEFAIHGPTRLTLHCRATFADELGEWELVGEGGGEFREQLRAVAGARRALPDRLSPTILRGLLTTAERLGYKAGVRQGRDVMGKERFTDGLFRSHARVIADLFAGLVIVALPGWERIDGYHREGVIDKVNDLVNRWYALREVNDVETFGAFLAAELAAALERHSRPIRPLWPVTPRLLATDLSVCDCVHVIIALPAVLDVASTPDETALALRTTLASLSLGDAV